VIEHAIDGFEILLGLVVQFLRFLLELLKSTLGIYVDGIFGVFADVELGFNLLRCLFQVEKKC
jgi:hypothetical protein